MRKTLLLTTLLLGALLTGCGNNEEKVNETKTEVNAVYERAINYSEELVEELNNCMYTEEEVEEMKYDFINQVEETWEEEGISEECKDEIIALAMSINYDDSFIYGYDYEGLWKGYLTILKNYEYFPVEYNNLTVDELYELIV